MARQDKRKEEGGGIQTQIRALKDELDESIVALIEATIQFTNDHK